MIIRKDGTEFYTNKELTESNKNDFVYVKNNSELFYKIINYFPNIFLNIQNGNLIGVDIDEKEINKNNSISAIKKEIVDLKANLSNTDYQVIKYVEGQLTEEEYQPIKEERQSWRDRINELEKELETI